MCCRWCPACVLCPLVLSRCACGLSLPLVAVVGLPCCAGSCCAVSPCVGGCCVALCGVTFCLVVGCHAVLPPPPPAPPGCCVFSHFISFRLCVGCAAPPPPSLLAVVRCVVRCRVSCCAVLRSVVWRVLRFAWCFVACLCWAGFLLRGVLVVLFLVCSAVLCCCVLCFFFFRRCFSVVIRAVSVCVVLCRSASCCSGWPCRVVFLCWFLLHCAV